MAPPDVTALVPTSGRTGVGSRLARLRSGPIDGDRGGVTVDGLVTGGDGVTRCDWAASDPLYVAYHDEEWGRPVRDDVRLFEKLCLEGFQAGLSWLTILRKRPAFRAAFAGFDPALVAAFDESDIERLLADAGIVRHRGKIEATINNARRYLELVEETGSLAEHVWSFAPDEPRPAPKTMADVPAQTEESRALSRDLKRRGWRFVGPTTCYAFMQAMGLVNDHLAGCDLRR
jgi:DNA-3-methyladenine glycosylase I